MGDVVYLDDSQIECDIPIEELTLAENSAVPEVDLEAILGEAVQSLMLQQENGNGGNAQTAMRRDAEGRYAAADGTLIISHSDDRPIGFHEGGRSTANACGPGLRGIRHLRQHGTGLQTLDVS